MENKCPKCGGNRRNLIQTKLPQDRTGTLCRKCGWSQEDVVSVTHNPACGECLKDLGRVDLREGEVSKTYICHECSAVRVKEERHDFDALTRFPILCSSGCGSQVAWIDHEEGKYASIDELSSLAMMCDRPECVARNEEKMRIARNLKAIDKIASNVGQ